MLNSVLKVLLISPLPPPAGGIATWTEQYVNWSKKNELKVDVVNTALIGKRLNKITSKIAILEEFKRTNSIIRNLKRKISQFKPNIVHLNTPCGTLGIARDYICAYIVKRSGVSLLVHYRCNIEDKLGKNLISKYFFRKLVGTADLNLVLNDASKLYISSNFGFKSIKISNFIDDSFNIIHNKEISNEIKIISFVGHVRKEKGIFEIIDVAKKLSSITFKLAGPITNEIEKITKPQNVEFLGILTKKSVIELLLESDVFLFPSYSEGFANVLLESMALGLPIISTPVGANMEMIENDGGIIVEVGKSESIYKAIIDMSNPSIRLRMSKWNTQKVKNNYEIQKVMGILFDLYQKLNEK